MKLLKSQFVNSRDDIYGVEDPIPLTPTHVTVPHTFLIEEADRLIDELEKLKALMSGPKKKLVEAQETDKAVN